MTFRNFVEHITEFAENHPEILDVQAEVCLMEKVLMKMLMSMK